jgi:hypothetical protein
MSGIVAGLIALWVIQIFQIFVAIGLLREIKTMRQSINENGLSKDRLQVGSMAPAFSEFDLQSGQQYSSNQLPSPGGILLFVSPSCPMCLHLVGSLHKLSSDMASQAVVVCQGNDKDCKTVLGRLQVKRPVLLDPTGGLSRRYGASVKPTVVLLSGDRRIRGYAHPQEAAEIEKLVKDSWGEVDDEKLLATYRA